VSEHGTMNGRGLDDGEARRRLMELGSDAGPGPQGGGPPAASEQRAGRRRRSEDGGELSTAAAELADPERARRLATRLGAALWNVNWEPLFGEKGSVVRLYRGLGGIRTGAVKISRQRELGQVLSNVAAACEEIEQEVAKGEAAGAKADRLEAEADALVVRENDLERQRHDLEGEREHAYENRARIRDGRAERPDPVELVPPTGQPLLARVTTAIGEHVKLLFAVDLVGVTVLLFTALSATLPSTVPFGLDILVASTAIGAGLLCGGAVAGYGLAAAEPPPRAAAALFALAGVAVTALGLYKLEAAYGATLAPEARSVLVVGTVGAVLVAAFTAFCDLVYRAAALRRAVLEGAGSLLGDTLELIARIDDALADVLAELADVKALRSAKLTAASELREIQESTAVRVAERRAALQRDEVTASTIEAVAATGAAQEADHVTALIAAATLAWLKFNAEPDEPKEVVPVGASVPSKARRPSLSRRLLYTAVSMLALSVMAAVLTGIAWVFVAGALVAALLVILALVLREREKRMRAVAYPAIPEGSVAPTSGLRPWIEHPDHLVPGYDRGPGNWTTDH
jgi:hypothetical protein